ncbi:MAG: hypothetical protein HXX10_22150 [Rhodoplanes sp.]|uniref:hypothetical protein n=1 Tax=Rhodoplanes sp. TaxID=1968906 RepID=UPI001815EAC8|nr:hypothetical protein [Rhodoplanes sp.]NVO16735.1 hypothetical protein [Rhodoplanes sp.]
MPLSTRPVRFGFLAAVLSMASLSLVATAAEAGWSARKGGGLGTLVSTTTPAGDEFFLFCSKTGLGLGLVARVSTRPGGPSDLTQLPVTVALDDKPAVALTVEGFDGAWVGTDATATAVARDIPAATAVTVTIAPSHAEGFEAARQVFVPGGGLAAATAKAGFPARCRVK